MRVKYNSEVKLNDIYLDKEDKCYMCEWTDLCPLMGAIETNNVYPAASKLEIAECGMFTQYDIN